MAVTTTQTPGPIDVAYGPNIITLTGAASGAKYAIQVRDFTGVEVLANIRQTPNTAGNAIFDIQNVLQSYVDPSPIGVEETRALLVSSNEVLQYRIYIGEEIGGVVATWTLEGTYQSIGGIKGFATRLWDSDTYQAIAIPGEGANQCTEITREALPLTDWNTQMLVSEIPQKYAVPNYLNSDDIVNVKYITRNDWQTISYINALDVDQGGSGELKGIEGIRIWSYELDDTVVVDDYAITNVVANSGGPNSSYGDGENPQGETLVLTVGTGPQNIINLDYQDQDNTTVNRTLSANTTHYYVTPVAWNPQACGGTGLEPAGYSEHGTHRTTMYILKEADCNDYDHIQFSWLNSYGYRDYYTFTKKNEKSTTRKADNYLKSNVDWNAAGWSANAGGRGFTTFNQEIKEVYSATTGYMTDLEASYLQGLFNSPDVRVKQGLGDWVACNINTNKYTEKTYRKDRLFQYTIGYQLANNIKSQKG